MIVAWTRREHTQTTDLNRLIRSDSLQLLGPLLIFRCLTIRTKMSMFFSPRVHQAHSYVQPSSQIPELNLLTPSISGSFRSSSHARCRIYRRWPQGYCLLNFIKHTVLTLLDYWSEVTWRPDSPDTPSRLSRMSRLRLNRICYFSEHKCCWFHSSRGGICKDYGRRIILSINLWGLHR
jgi:hypothetical protein